MIKQHIVFLTGAGISVESGLSTFRGKNGLWTNEEWAYLASTDALYNDTQRCLDFYNFRRKQLTEVEPNDAHRMIAELEKEHDVTYQYIYDCESGKEVNIINTKQENNWDVGIPKYDAESNSFVFDLHCDADIMKQIEFFISDYF